MGPRPTKKMKTREFSTKRFCSCVSIPNAARKSETYSNTGPVAQAQRNLGLAYATLAERNQSKLQANESFRNLVKAMRDFPGDDVEIPHALGRIFLAREKMELAVDLFERVVKVESNNALWLQSLADGLHAHGRVQAIATLERAIELDPLMESSYRVLATIHAETGDRDLAAKTRERYLERVPDSVYARQAKRSLESDEEP